MQAVILGSSSNGIEKVQFKAPRARKVETFVSYGFDSSRDKVILQSATRIMEVSIEDNTLRYTPAVPSGAYYIHLNMQTTTMELPQELKEQVLNLK